MRKREGPGGDMIKKGMDWSSGKTWSGVIKHGVIK